LEILFLLIPLSLALLVLIVWALMWAIRNRQFDDLAGPAHRVLMDDDRSGGRDAGEADGP
jgi:cbb3-type cytochrome oxidase maturation protein